ncbi:MAG TPA: hypothetical protein VMP68_17775 [Candidatus Eisenbacteria bacterium]|nr:hypothetical protein [Candidatus Eisenbacteria bacterium]
MQASSSQSLEKLLLIRSLEADTTVSESTSTKARLADLSGLIAGALLLLVGTVGLHWCPNALGQRLSEALFISGVLTIAVDPFLKKRLLHEAALDIFHHLLGFGLPEEIRLRLRAIVQNTNLYRKDMLIIAVFTMTEQGMMHIDFETSYELLNPSGSNLPFAQTLDFEKGEHPVLSLVSCNQARQGYGQGATLEHDDKGQLAYQGKTIKIAPSSQGKRYLFSASYSVEGFPFPGFYTHTFKYPTIGTVLRVRNQPPSVVITSDLGHITNGECVAEDRLFMPGDHFNIRWERESV